MTNRTESRLAVLLVSTQTEPKLGADVWVHAQIARSLDRRTHEVHVAYVPARRCATTPFAREVGDRVGTNICPVNFGGRGDGSYLMARLRTIYRAAPILPSMFRLALYVRRHQIAIIHTTDRPRDAITCVAVGRLTRTPCIVHVHVVFREWIRGPSRWALRHADARIGVSEFVAQSLIEGGHARATTFAATNAIAIDRWTPGEGREKARAEFGVEPDDPVILSACRLFPEKGPRELIRAIADVRREFPRTRLWIVGEDVSAGKSFSRELDELVSALDLRNHVVFTGRRDDMVALMAGADIFAMPSFEEPFGLVFAEAMAMELPVVGLANGGTCEIVEHDATGLLSPPGDHEQLVEHLLRLLRDPDLRTRMGKAGRERIAREFTVPRLASDVARIYRVVA